MTLARWRMRAYVERRNGGYYLAGGRVSLRVRHLRILAMRRAGDYSTKFPYVIPRANPRSESLFYPRTPGTNGGVPEPDLESKWDELEASVAGHRWVRGTSETARARKRLTIR